MNRGVGTRAAQNGKGFAHRHAARETTVGVAECDPRLPGRQRRLEDDNAPGQINRPDPSHLDHGDTVPPTADNRALSDRGVTSSAQPAHPTRQWRRLQDATPMGGPAAHRRTATELEPKCLGRPRAVRQMHCFAGQAVRISGHRCAWSDVTETCCALDEGGLRVHLGTCWVTSAADVGSVSCASMSPQAPRALCVPKRLPPHAALTPYARSRRITGRRSYFVVRFDQPDNRTERPCYATCSQPSDWTCREFKQVIQDAARSDK